MKTYKATRVITEEPTPEVILDLINVEDESDRIMCAPDEFTEGDIVTELDITCEENMYIDADGNCGTGLFAYNSVMPY